MSPDIQIDKLSSALVLEKRCDNCVGSNVTCLVLFINYGQTYGLSHFRNLSNLLLLKSSPIPTESMKVVMPQIGSSTWDGCADAVPLRHRRGCARGKCDNYERPTS